MTVYIALLRGINVGGKNRIKMTVLKQVFETIGLFEVQTYIQSGNVLFKSTEAEGLLQQKIEKELEAVFKFSIPIILRTAAELEKIIRNCPFSGEEILEAEASSKVESLYVGLLSQIPLKEKIETFNAYQSESDKYQIIGRNIYLLFKNSIRNSKLANNLHKLDVPATVRNWKTISKLASLAKEMEK